MNLTEQVESLDPKYTILSEKLPQETIGHFREVEKTSNVKQVIFKITVNKVFLNQLRDNGIPEQLLEFMIINYDSLTKDE